MDLYGNPPFALEENIGGELPSQIGRTALFQWIESELLDLVSGSDMPAVGTVGYPRVTKGTAQALLARMYLNAEVYTGTARWADARSAAEATIGMGYQLCNNYEELFMQDNSENANAQKEMILQLVTIVIELRVGGGQHIWFPVVWMMPIVKLLQKNWDIRKEAISLVKDGTGIMSRMNLLNILNYLALSGVVLV